MAVVCTPTSDDRYGYESASERWLPIHTVESILVSVISMISTPNIESPANIDAGKVFRDDPADFRKRVQRTPGRASLLACAHAHRPPSALAPALRPHVRTDTSCTCLVPCAGCVRRSQEG